MPGAAEFQALAGKLRGIAAVPAQAAGGADLTRWQINSIQAAADRPAWWAREAAENEAAATAAAAIEKAWKAC